MLKFSEVTGHQLTDENGVDGDWEMKHQGRLLFNLPASTTVQETFTIRDQVGVIYEEAYQAGIKQANEWAEQRLNRIVTEGDARLDALKQENERLSAILETTLGEESL